MKFIDSEERPWGLFYVIHDEKKYKIKRIEVNPGQRLSYQFHNKRSETWVIIQGCAHITINDEEKKFNEGETVTIPVQAKHRVQNKTEEKLIFIEIQTGSYFGEDDIVRIQDDYNR